MLHSMGSARDSFISPSLEEAVAFVRFVKSGRDPAEWPRLNEEDKLTFIVEDWDTHACIKYLKDAHVCLDNFHADLYGKPVPSRSEQLPEVVSKIIRDAEAQDAILEEIEGILLRPYVASCIDPSQRCHIGHLLHGLVAICRKNVPHPWTSYVSVLDTSAGHCLFQQNFIQPDVTIFLGLLCSETHWALAVTDLENAVCVLYDGQGNPVVKENAVAWISSFTVEIELQCAECPRQVDDFSCGQRVLLAAEYVLKSRFGHRREMFPLKLPEDFASDARMQALKSLVRTHTVEQEPVEQEPVVSSSSGSHQDPSSEEPRPSDVGNVAGPRESGAAGSSRKRSSPSADGPTTPPRRQRAPPPQDSPPGKVPKALAAGRLKRILNEQVKTITAGLREKGLVHNKVFQQRHAAKMIPPESGHWRQFLEKLAEKKELKCEACNELANEYYFSKPDEKKEKEEETAPPEVAADVPRKRGRPTKNAMRKGVLQQFVAAKRVGVYTELEDSGATFVYRCVPCGKNISFFRDGMTYMFQHEKVCRAHTAGLQAMGLRVDGSQVAARGPCSGADVTGSDSKLGSMLQSLECWLHAGQPMGGGEGAVKSSLEAAAWRVEGNRVVARHVSCSGSEVVKGIGCQSCRGLLDNVKITREVATWAFKLDLCHLAYLVAYGKEAEREAQRNHILGSDYRAQSLAGQDAEEWFALAPRAFIFGVRRLVESCPKRFRNAALEDLVQLRLTGLAEHSLGNLQQSAFVTLMDRFQTSIVDLTVLFWRKILGSSWFLNVPDLKPLSTIVRSCQIKICMITLGL